MKISNEEVEIDYNNEPLIIYIKGFLKLRRI